LDKLEDVFFSWDFPVLQSVALLFDEVFGRQCCPPSCRRTGAAALPGISWDDSGLPGYQVPSVLIHFISNIGKDMKVIVVDNG
jgi:hypothetical protein